MIRIAICDDSPAFLNQTKFMIDHWDAPVPLRIATELFEDGDALLSAHAKKPFDIVLLDIVMPLFSGIEAARELRERDDTVKIVFLTSSTEFAIESYSVKASNYLLKPLHPDSFFNCLDELIGEIQTVAKRITIKGIEATHRLPVNDIIYVEAQRKHVVFHLSGDRSIESLEPFYSFEYLLLLEDGFFKCHRSYIVNIHRIDNYTPTEIVMTSGDQIPIARSCHKSFEAAYFHVFFGEVGDITQ